MPAEAAADEREDKFAGLDGRRAHPPEDPAPRHATGIEEDIDEALDERGARENDEAVDLLNNGAAAGDEGRRRPLRPRRADPALRAAVRRGHEAGGRASSRPTSTRRRARRRARSCWRPSSATCTTSARASSTRSSPTTATRPSTSGRQVPIQVIIDKAVEVGADAIGLSALLVSTSKQMPLCLHELDARGLDVPGAGRRRGDQPLVRPAHPLPGGRRAVRAGRLLLQGRVRGPRR